MIGAATTQEAALINEPAPAQEHLTPAPTATGNDRVTILKHELSLTDALQEIPTPPGVELAIRNVSDSELATVAFEAEFYDQDGAVLEHVKHHEVELQTETSRGIRISSSIPPHEAHKVKSYHVRIVRTTTIETECLQLRRHEIRTTGAGEHVQGIVKNIGGNKVDAAVCWTFFDPRKENIGTQVLILKDIEPKTIRQYDFIFKPQAGEIVRTYTISIGKVQEQAVGETGKWECVSADSCGCR